MTFIPTLIGGISSIGGGLSALGGILAANPVTLVIAAIAALIAIFVALWNNCEGFREFWINLWIAFGDSMNDLEMIQTAGLSICMANGSEELKKIADEVCPAVSEDGLYQSFAQHGLI